MTNPEYTIAEEELRSPERVAALLGRYQRWRLGTGEYEYNEDPTKNRVIPYSPHDITRLLDAALGFLGKLK